MIMKNYFLFKLGPKNLKMKKEKLLVILVLLLAVALRISFLEKIPYRVDGDASRFALDGLKAWQDNWPLFGTGWYGHTNLLFYIIGGFLKIFGNNLVGLRLFSVLGGILGVLATYLFAKEFFNGKIALWTSLFLAVCPFHLVFSRVGTEVIWMTFFAPITLYFLAKRTLKAAFFAGIFVGLAQYFYPGARLIPILTIGFLAILFLNRQIKLKQALILLFFCLIGFLIVYAPMIGYYWQHPENYWARVNIVGVFQSGWLENGLEAKSLPQVLFRQIINSFLVFHFPVKGTPFWFVRTPYLDPLAIFLFTLGLVMGIWRTRRWQFQFLCFYLLVGIFFGGALTISSPTPSRYVILFPLIACFIAVGTNRIDEFLRKEVLRRTAVSILATALITTSFYSYWLHETKDVWNYDLNTQVATYAGRYLKTVSRDYKIYFVGNDYLYYNAAPSLPFLTGKEGKDLFGSMNEVIKKAKPNVRTFFIVIPARESELVPLQTNLPYGKTTAFYNPRGDFLFWLFEI